MASAWMPRLRRPSTWGRMLAAVPEAPWPRMTRLLIAPECYRAAPHSLAGPPPLLNRRGATLCAAGTQRQLPLHGREVVVPRPPPPLPGCDSRHRLSTPPLDAAMAWMPAFGARRDARLARSRPPRQACPALRRGIVARH